MFSVSFSGRIKGPDSGFFEISPSICLTESFFKNRLHDVLRLVTVVQLVEHLIVVQVVVGSSPIGHPISFHIFPFLFISGGMCDF